MIQPTVGSIIHKVTSPELCMSTEIQLARGGRKAGEWAGRRVGRRAGRGASGRAGRGASGQASSGVGGQAGRHAFCSLCSGLWMGCLNLLQP